MAEKLSITIALEGGKQIEQQLAGIGQAGQKAFQDISQAAQQAGGFKNLKPEEVTTKLQQMGVTGVDALQKISGAVAEATRLERMVGIVQGIESGFASLSAAAGTFVRALGPIGAIAGTIGGALVKTMIDAASAIHNADTAAIKLGMSIEKFDSLRVGMEKAGFSAKAIAAGIEAINSAAEKGRIEAVANALKVLQDVTLRGFGGLGTQQLLLLLETAERVGPAADAAKKALEKLGVKPGIFSEMTTSLGDLIAKLGETAGLKAFITELLNMTNVTNRNAVALRELGAAFGTELVQAINNGTISLNNNGASIDALVAKYQGMTQEQANAAATWDQSVNRMSAAWERLKTTVGGTLLVNVPDNLVSTMQTIDNLLNPAKWSEWGAAATQAFVDIFLPLGELEVKFAQLVAKLGSDIWSAFSNAGIAAANAVSSAIDVVSSAIDAVIAKLKALAAAIASIGRGGGTPGSVTPIPGNASGGLIGGRGTGTSDSNLSWVSRGEYIEPARVVRQPGVLALLEALRRTGGNLRGVMSGMGRFAAGGLIPRFAEGGLVGGGGMGHLGTVDLRTDHGQVRLMASSSAVDQLSRLAVTKRMTSTGRKPGFVG